MEWLNSLLLLKWPFSYGEIFSSVYFSYEIYFSAKMLTYTESNYFIHLIVIAQEKAKIVFFTIKIGFKKARKTISIYKI